MRVSRVLGVVATVGVFGALPLLLDLSVQQTLFSLLTVIAIVSALIWQYRAKPIEGIPLGKPSEYWPILGHLPWFLRMASERSMEKNFVELTQACVKRGDSCFQNNFFRLPSRIWICEPKLISYVFDEHFEEFGKCETLEVFDELLGQGIFIVDPPMWRPQRKTSARMFSMRNLKDFMFECSTHSSEMTMRKLHSLLGSRVVGGGGGESASAEVDMFDLLGRFTLSSFLEISFGRTLDDIVGSYPESHPFSDSFDRMQVMMFKRVLNPLWRYQRFFGVGTEKTIAKDAKVIRDFAVDLLDLSNRGGSGSTSSIKDESGMGNFDVVSLYLTMKKDATEQQLKDFAMNLVIAGRDTTRLLLSWFLWCYGCGSVMTDKHRSEIDRELSAIISSEDGIMDLTYTVVNQQLPFTEQCLLEVLRLYPPVKMLFRSPKKDATAIPVTVGGNPKKKTVLVNRNTLLTVRSYAVHRSEKFFDEPLKFKPERWTNGLQTFPPNVFTSFNLNPRLCLGRHFALMEAKVFLVHFWNEFRFQLKSTEEPTIVRGPLLNMEQGLPVIITRKNQ